MLGLTADVTEIVGVLDGVADLPGVSDSLAVKEREEVREAVMLIVGVTEMLYEMLPVGDTDGENDVLIEMVVVSDMLRLIVGDALADSDVEEERDVEGVLLGVRVKDGDLVTLRVFDADFASAPWNSTNAAITKTATVRSAMVSPAAAVRARRQSWPLC